ncbi:ASCH domain-containing protein [Candidatus Saccharibacteria bacterium]|nr:ASCH domain-containing protein [Candidatus Saccharibacteria bacterium]
MVFHDLPIVSNEEFPFLDAIRNYEKPVEGRVNVPKYHKYRPGDIIIFKARNDTLWAVVTYIHRYESLDAYLDGEGYKQAIPWAKSKEEAESIYNKWSTPDNRKKHGFVGIGIKPIKVIECSIREPYFEQIKSGSKKVEGRLYRDKWAKVDPDDLLHINKSFYVKVDRVSHYNSFKRMLQCEKCVIPGKPLKEALDIYYDIYKDRSEEIRYGVVAIRIVRV